MGIEFKDSELVIGGTEWTYAPFRFSEILKIGSGIMPTWQDVIVSGAGSLTLLNAKADGLNYLKLYGGCEKDFTPISMDYETVYNMQHSTFDLSKFTVVGGSTITDAGLVTDTAVWDKYVQIPINKLDVTSPFEVNFRVIKNTFTSNNQLIGGGSSSSNITIYASGSRYGDCRVRVYDSNTAQSSEVRVVSSWDDVQAIPDNTSVDVNISWDGTNYYYKVTNVSNGTVYANTSATSDLPLDTINYNNIIGNFVTSSGCYFDLKNTYIIQGGVIVFSGNITGTDTYTVNGSTVSIPYTLSSMGDKIAESAYLTSIQAVIENLQTSTYIVINNSNQTATDYRGRIICNNGEIKCSANLCDVKADNVVVGQYIGADGTIGDNVNNYYYSKFIKVQPNTSYTLSFSESVYFASISEYSTADDSGFVVRKTAQSSVTTPPFDITYITITTEATTNYIRFGSNIFRTQAVTLGDVLAIDWMLNIGSTAMPYRPYGQIYTDGTTETVEVDTTGDTATAEMLLKVGTYQDVQSVLDGEVTRNIGIKVFDGTETGWVRGTSSIYIDGLFDDAIGYSADNPAITCSHFKGFPPTTKVSSMLDLSAKLGASNQSRRVYFVYDAMTTASQFQQFLANQYNAGTPVIIVYPLATPTTETVTAQPLTIQAGTNIVQITQASMDNLELEVSYKAGVAVTITEIENAQLDNSVEVTING